MGEYFIAGLGVLDVSIEGLPSYQGHDSPMMEKQLEKNDMDTRDFHI